ncbi:uncharacterized protein LOC132745561 [Ruditapes philippinarum]|uniref:uncharacterized protein LOC132745561 n=1 Tax=Ruditapes philippinarum TaxID=129788 RepID=UPI00295B2997|nr:uncharacterized protein LOC132745561 [Ruditapes philippinarum]
MYFLFSPNFSSTIDCMRDHLDPTCGPDTDAYVFNRSLAVMPANFSYEDYCKNDSAKELEKLLQCQTMFSKVNGFVDCVTGTSLNKTIDFTDTCRFLQTSFGCSYKYTKIMCPSFVKTFVESSEDSLKNCNIDELETVEEVMVCDKDMERACFVAYKPPPVTSNSSEFAEFICSERSRGLQTCLRTVYAMCKNSTDFNSSSVDKDIQSYETQTAVFCSEKGKAMEECQAKFSKLNAFQDCIMGKTLNTTIDPTDTCLFLQNSVDCTYKYTDLMCPEYLDLFNKSILFPSFCDQNKEMSKAGTSCDMDMSQTCNAGFNPPITADTDVYFEFVCSGRAGGYASCVQKVQSLCHIDTSTTDELRPFNQSSATQTGLICENKSGFTDYITCLRTQTFQNEYANCSAEKVESNITESCSKYGCQLQSLQSTCPQSAKFYQKLNYNSLVACKVVEATTTGTADQTTITSSGSFLGLSIPVLAVVSWNTYIRVLV